MWAPRLRWWAACLAAATRLWRRVRGKAAPPPQRKKYSPLPGEESLVGMTKAERKKWRREQRWLQKKERRKQQRAEERRRDRRRKKAAREELLADMSEKEKRAYFENLRQEKEESEASIRRAYQEGRPKVVINCPGALLRFPGPILQAQPNCFLDLCF
ncbi:unnamed protein product [Effrenium voratum]|uniref:Uncharacterized protein n=1 Tax=Effrenium voratum TaxID=2562239 RepID=A0AA36IBB1_9DINO|nr:unnamed protein product [Effrenium voratum]